ncbi:hypothetical protein DXT99_26095 [Pontibacter diazotrophicus]|uniref:Uncharacterized protein n=1 Tax=Pontibacter diazotrophicus TaxID=1400979 RepID=A0A3D8KZV2_9BACT|nr:hypothetical protein [Pontibacter diazotrophicus]RDV10708.1 hypothetical protein DXT99_26095 [Pontibacter diazotrophicus]
MKRQVILSFFFFLIWLTAVSQERPSVYIDASTDSVYHHKTIDYLNEQVIPKCNLGSLPTWTEEYGAPRSLTFLFKIQINSEGKIVSVITDKAEISYRNTKGKTVKEPIKGEPFCSRIGNCYREGILNLKKLNTLMLNDANVNTEVPFVVRWEGI